MPPTLHGLSGGSIWRSYYVNREGEGGARVVAVQTGTYRNTSITKGTRWALVVKMLHDSSPHVRRALSLELPRSGV